MAGLTDVYRGNANTWECDENGHLNVMFFTKKANEGIRVLLQYMGLGRTELAEQNARVFICEQHIRFLREFRPGGAVLGRAGVLEVHDSTMRVYCELVDNHSQAISATFNCIVEYRNADDQPAEWPSDVSEAAEKRMVELPKHAQPRSIDLSESSIVETKAPVLADAEAMGMAEIGLGSISSTECALDGHIRNECYMGRISDAVVHFSAKMRPTDTGKTRSLAKYGGAVLEYRLHYHHDLTEGDCIVVRSGLKHVGDKANSIVHWMFNSATGALVCSSEAVAITLDLKERKVVSIPDDRRAHLESIVIPGVAA